MRYFWRIFENEEFWKDQIKTLCSYFSLGLVYRLQISLPKLLKMFLSREQQFLTNFGNEEFYKRQMTTFRSYVFWGLVFACKFLKNIFQTDNNFWQILETRKSAKIKLRLRICIFLCAFFINFKFRFHNF
jgi:hypothetical protein